MYAIWFYLFQYIYDKINDFNLEIKANHILKSAKILIHLIYYFHFLRILNAFITYIKLNSQVKILIYNFVAIYN